MLTTIIKKELLENILSFRFPLFFLICIILIPLALYVNNLDYQKRLRDYNEQLRLADETLSTSRMWDVMSGTVALKGFRRPSPLSIFARGFESTLPQFYGFQKDGYQQGEPSASEESILSVQGKLDFLFIMQMIISLIALLFAASVISGEKELGTLRGALSNSIPRDTLLMGKLIGGYLTLWLPFIVAFLVGLLPLTLTSFPLFEPDILIKIFVIILSTSFFMLTYFTIGVMVSASAGRTRTSLIAVLLVWAFLQLVVPKLGDMIAAIVYPIKTETLVSMEKSLATKALETEKAKELGQLYLRVFGREYQYRGYVPQREPTSEERQWEELKKEMDKEYDERIAKLVQDIEQAYSRERGMQHSMATNISLLSPNSALTRFLTDVCQTGELDKKKYIEAVENYQRVLDTQIYGRIRRVTLIFPSGSTSSSSSMEGGDFDLKTLPKFAISPTALHETLRNNWRSLVSLVFWLIAPFAVAYVAFLRYDVR